ncbi:hypothetical protein FGO68_gene10017 [Halteria grandinella]|uniref:Uncharacterized protein n=1 Tax=Halteria grandinella TaxID=5974 RepID=A0A8J8NGC6_HALGN|nr:hypothetical protein FGO68_gene10017 [Halteria grandinella]
MQCALIQQICCLILSNNPLMFYLHLNFWQILTILYNVDIVHLFDHFESISLLSIYFGEIGLSRQLLLLLVIISAPNIHYYQTINSYSPTQMVEIFRIIYTYDAENIYQLNQCLHREFNDNSKKLIQSRLSNRVLLYKKLYTLLDKYKGAELKIQKADSEYGEQKVVY